MTMNSLATSPLPATATMSQLGSISRNCPGKCENQALSNDPCWRSQVYDGSFGWEKTLKNGLGQRTDFVACWDVLGWGMAVKLKIPQEFDTEMYWVYWLYSGRAAVSSVFNESNKYHQLLVRLVVCRGCKAKVWSGRQLPLVGLITSCHTFVDRSRFEADFRGLGRIVLNLGLSLPVALHCCAHEHTRHIVTYPTLRSTSVGFRLPSQLESA